MRINCQTLMTPAGWLENQCVTIGNGVITAINPISESPADFSVTRLVPGFIDLQVNGGGGVLLNQNTSANAVTTIFQAHHTYGTTGMLPTLITDSTETMRAAVKAISAARQHNPGAIIGVHFEGPWLSQARKGVHPSEHIRPPTTEELNLLCHSELGQVLVTLAPETVSPTTIKTLVDAGVIVFLGHSEASAEQTQAALDAGASGFTHLFNAMSPLQTRQPGMVGVALQSEHSYAGLIVDGHHVDPICCTIAVKCLGPERLCLVTDAMALAASEQTEMPFFNTTISKANNKLTTPDGTLAGSCLTMLDAVRNLVNQCQVSLYDAITMASSTPAKALGVEQQRGNIAVGMRADLVALDADLNIQNVFLGGVVRQPER